MRRPPKLYKEVIDADAETVTGNMQDFALTPTAQALLTEIREGARYNAGLLEARRDHSTSVALAEPCNQHTFTDLKLRDGTCLVCIVCGVVQL